MLSHCQWLNRDSTPLSFQLATHLTQRKSETTNRKMDLYADSDVDRNLAQADYGALHMRTKARSLVA